MALPAQNPYSFSQSVGAAGQVAKTMGYLEDREIMQQDRKARQEATQQKSKEKAQGQIRQIFGSIDMDGPEFYDHMRMAAGWFGKENPEFAQEAVEIANLPEPELREWAKSNKKMMGMEDAEIKQPKTEQLTLYGPQGATKRVAAEKGKDFTPEEGWSLSKPTKGMKIYDSTGNLIVDTSGGDMSKKTMGTLEGGTMGDYETLHQLEEIKSVYDDKFLTYAGKAKGWFNKIKEKSGFDLSENDKEFIGTKKKFDQRVNQFFNSYRKLITGAAASVQELASLKEAVLNVDQSPTEFKAAYDDMVQGYQRSIRLNHRILREGVKQGTKDWGKRFDSLYMSGGDDVVGERAEEIKGGNPNITDEEIAGILMSEGYQ